MDKVTGSLGPRRGIAATIKKLREDSGKVLSEVARDLMISTSKLSRLENAQGKPLPRDIRDIISYYGIDATPTADRLRQWVAAAQSPGWWTNFDDDLFGPVIGGFGLDEHVAYEADATVKRMYSIPFVPALLQTPDYARAVFRDLEHRSPQKVDQLVAIRGRRQDVLRTREGLPPLRLVAVTHESTLRQVVGSVEILRDQLDALILWSEAPNVSLHVLPFTAGAVFTMTCMYAYFEYEVDRELDVVHVETHAGYWSIENPGKVAEYRRAHDALVEASLNEDGSRALIRSFRDGK
jgi:transcriptional regulator with XRE-family HTH domain